MARTVETAKTNATWTDRAQRPARRLHRHGQTAENVATSLGISRERQDEWGVTSQNRAEKAIANGFFEREIPVTMPDGRVVSTDDGHGRASPSRASAASTRSSGRTAPSPPATTPAHDDAAAVVFMSDTKAAELGLTPLARVVATGVSGLSPEIMGLGPIEASRQALARAGMTIGDMDPTRSTRPSRRSHAAPTRSAWTSTDWLKLARGVALFISVTRITTTLLNGMQERDAQFGLETMG